MLLAFVPEAAILVSVAKLGSWTYLVPFPFPYPKPRNCSLSEPGTGTGTGTGTGASRY